MFDLFSNDDRVENDVGKELRGLEENLVVVRIVESVAAVCPSGINISSPRKSVWFLAETSCAIIDNKPLFFEILRPTSLSSCEDILLAEIFEASMVCKDENLVLSSFEIVSPVAESFDDDVEFFVVYLVVAFGRIEGSRVKRDRMEFVVWWTILGEDETHRVVGGIALDDYRICWVEVDENWGGSEGGFEGFESLVCSFIPKERDVLASEASKGNDDF